MTLETSPEVESRVVDKQLALVSVEDVTKHFPIGAGLLGGGSAVRAVDGVSFEVRAGETLGLVGESGCGKSTLGRVIAQLHPATSGKVIFQGQDLVPMRGEKLRRMRQELQMIFQDPYASLNPRMTVGEIIGEPLKNFGLARGKERSNRVHEVMRTCGLNPNFLNRYPHEFSGGQRQRIGIARALVLNPTFIVADEPISALDVSIQAQIVNLMEDLQNRFKLTYLFIAHDLSVVRHLSDRVAVMYLGKIMEIADSHSIYENPLHPYTKALLSSIPIPDPDLEAKRQPILLQGEIPSPVNPPSGCRFHTRCPIAQFPICSEQVPPLESKVDGHLAACHFAGQL
ncbi:MAG: dipeptide ABC transporter ATP-binding protein [Candidatus Dormibacteraeota bacterium]|uniref:Dipeptide ABC transporter ATP-binding protein n=1 Tax=Candidatus Dormiibacter inghamiae TaxID=3127013 RepID=A0A934K8P1_9BACT|nr:dipeptide ABC transporter ATP-binding protein [Candidatus Dormibacteraeota bacterium]MBJ7605427.1 dipeptide ABC transporter ATP-binding protein [Candidatus Dormibacteraeota bacterium]